MRITINDVSQFESTTETKYDLIHIDLSVMRQRTKGDKG